MKFLCSITIIVVIILVGCTVFAVQNIQDTTRLSLSAKIHFLNWYDEDGDCSDKSVKCEEYFETVHHLPCYFVYGDRDSGTDDWAAHMWNIVMIDGIPFEFESTILVFEKVSEEYTVQTMQEGFYVDGVEYEKSQELDNWRELI